MAVVGGAASAPADGCDLELHLRLLVVGLAEGLHGRHRWRRLAVVRGKLVLGAGRLGFSQLAQFRSYSRHLKVLTTVLLEVMTLSRHTERWVIFVTLPGLFFSLIIGKHDFLITLRSLGRQLLLPFLDGFLLFLDVG